MDPFEQSITTTGTTADSLRDQSCGVAESTPGPGIFVYDLETVPDEASFPRPTKDADDFARDVDFEAALKTADAVKAEIAKGLTEAQALDLLAKEQAGKCRKTVISELRKAADESDRELREWKQLALDPWSCRIVALGIQRYTESEVVAVTARNTQEEIKLLSLFWEYAAQGVRCGYNIRGFDDPVIVARSLILGVTAPHQMELSRFSDKRSVDLMQVAFGGRIRDAMPLKKLVRRLDIDPPAGDMDGSQVLDLVDAGCWDQLEEYVVSDVVVEMELLRRLQTVVVV